MSRAAHILILWLCLFSILSSGLNLQNATAAESLSSSSSTNAQTFFAAGIIEKISPDIHQIVIRHGAISNYMGAMTMPFNVRDPNLLANFQRGDQIHFQLHVTENESWVDQIVKTGNVALPENKKTDVAKKSEMPRQKNPLLDFKFTNELGQAVCLNDFHGQALAITFFYTRCPLPDFCPRLSKNFQEAAQQLESMTNAPRNWHLLSFTFDPDFDTPERLKNYGENYHYDPAHWSFLTGPKDKLAELARDSGVTYEADEGLINHNFRTLIVNASGHLQTVFPTTGDLSDQIVAELLKAAATNTIVSSK